MTFDPYDQTKVSILYEKASAYIFIRMNLQSIRKPLRTAPGKASILLPALAVFSCTVVPDNGRQQLNIYNSPEKQAQLASMGFDQFSRLKQSNKLSTNAEQFMPQALTEYHPQ